MQPSGTICSWSRTGHRREAAVIPAEAGIHTPSAQSGKLSHTERGMDSRLRGNDGGFG